MDGLTETTIKKLKVKELRAELQKRNLSTKGNKKELAGRLLEAVEDESVEVEEKENVDVSEEGCEMEECIVAPVNGTFSIRADDEAPVNGTFTIGANDEMDDHVMAKEPKRQLHRQRLAENKTPSFDTPPRGADPTEVVRTLYHQLKRYDEKFKESEEENAQLRYNCSEKFNELSREMKILKERNVESEMESQQWRERSRRMEIEIDLLKEKNMMLETVMNRMKNSCEKEEEISMIEPFVVSRNSLAQGGDEQQHVSTSSCKRIKLHHLNNIPQIGRERTDVIISDDNHAHFQEGIWSTIVASAAVTKNGDKCYYEVTFIDDIAAEDGSCEIGWCTQDFLRSEKSGYVGKCPYSYGFNGTYQVKLHNQVLKNWGVEFPANNGHVLGVAADMTKGNLLYGLDGNWCSPMGVAFDNLDTDMGVFPAITGSNIKLFVNFGEVDFRFSPPDPSYKKLGDLS